MKQFLKMFFASCLGIVVAGVVVIFIFFGALGAFISSVGDVFSSPNKKNVKIEANSVLLLDLKGKISDTPAGQDVWQSLSTTSGEQYNYSLQEVTRAIDAAIENPNIKGIALDIERSLMGFATAQELRHHLKLFKESGKPVYAYASGYTDGNYYISSLADSLYMNPAGNVVLKGLASQIVFMRGPLEKLGVEMQVFKVGKFKGAVEPFVQDKLSDANRQQIQEMLDSLWFTFTREEALSRGLHQDTLQAIANGGYMLEPSEYAINHKLVDALVYRSQWEERVSTAITGDPDQKATFVRVSDVLAATPNNKKGSKIALVIAEGAIQNVDPDQQPIPSPFSSNGPVISLGLAKQLRKLANDETIEAVVMRVNSPGGDAFVSDAVYNEVEYLKSKKPIVVSMGDYAASGGYYISAPASLIVAQPATLTGSIGIFGLFPNFAGTAKKINLTQETLTTAKYADLGNMLRPMRPDEKEVMQRMINNGYDQFLTRVANGRNMTKEQVNEVGQGRVWVGSKAIQLGLVDKLGGLQTAIQEAARLANLEEYYIAIDEPEKSWLQKLMSLSAQSSSSARYLLMPEAERMFLETVQQVRQQSGIRAIPPYDITTITLPAAGTPIQP